MSFSCQIETVKADNANVVDKIFSSVKASNSQKDSSKQKMQQSEQKTSKHMGNGFYSMSISDVQTQGKVNQSDSAGKSIGNKKSTIMIHS